MKRIVIDGSSNIAEIGYDMPSMTMQIKFHNGSIYDYWPVSKNMYDRLMSAESKGKYFSRYIRGNQSISYQKVDI